jgi:hypothetical protein
LATVLWFLKPMITCIRKCHFRDFFTNRHYSDRYSACIILLIIITKKWWLTTEVILNRKVSCVSCNLHPQRGWSKNTSVLSFNLYENHRT